MRNTTALKKISYQPTQLNNGEKIKKQIRKIGEIWLFQKKRRIN